MSIQEPVKITVPFADSGLKNTIPQAANNTTGKAGFDKGFPERTMLPKVDGGIPPSGMDFNGILFDVTSVLRYMQAGGQPTFDAALATAIGGYPAGAILSSDDGMSLFRNTVDGNSTNPNLGGDGWTRPDLQVMELYRRSYAEVGYNVVGTFQAGFTYVNTNDVGIDKVSGKGFTGPVGPVAAGTNPASGGFVDRSSELLRQQVMGMSYAQLRAYTGASTSIYVYGRSNAFDGAFGWFDLVPSDTTSSDDDGVTLVGIDGRRWRRRFVGDVRTLWFGDVGDSTPDSTLAIQRSLDFAGSMGGGAVVMGPGIRYLSMANSVSPYSCLLIPKNVELKGAGSALTTISRLPAERGVDGILLVNKNYDVFGGYGADGNITVRGFTITDGAATPSRALGDLIAICHCDGFRAYDINGGNHDQHLFDICSSKNVWIDPSCTGINASPEQASATIQIDGTNSLGVWGAVIDNTPLENVYVRGSYKNTGALRAVELFHSNFTNYKNVDIDLDMDAAYISGSSCIAIDPNQTSINVDGLKIRGTLTGNHGSAVLCNLFNNVADGYRIDGVDIDIKTKGKGRGGIFAGIDTATSGRWGTVKIKHNARLATTLAEYAAGYIYGQKFAGIDNLILNEECDVEISRDTGSGALYVAACAVQACGGRSIGGRYKASVYASGGKYVTPFYVSRQNGASRNLDFKISSPTLDAGAGVGHHFLGENATNGSSLAMTAADNVLLSGAKFIGSASISNILEPIRLSDGSNGYRQVQLDGSGNAEFAIASGQLYENRQMGLKKTGAAAELSTFKIIYAPNAGGLDDDAEEIQFAYISGTSCAGTQICDVNLAAGNFSILTGVSGVSAVINNSNFQPVIRTSGVIKVWCSI